jgi:4-amino-4-deoxy-L-arabinose transferase-like glycosyltransferase
VEVWLLAGITAAGAAVRFATIATQSYWFDEAATVHELHLSFGALLHAVANKESTPPLYYVLAWMWAKAFGTGEIGLRSLSALAGVGAIPVAYLCGRELFSRSAGLLAAAFTALSPFLIWYSQEARAYMLFSLLCGLSFLFFVRAWRRRSTRDLVWWGACSSLAVLTHFFAGFVVAPEALWLLVALRSRAALIAGAVIALLQLALIPLLVVDVGHPLLGWITQFPRSIRIEQVPVALGFGTLYQSPLVDRGLLGGALLVVVLAVLVVFGADRRGRVAAAAAAAVVASMLLLPLVVALAGRDYYVARNLIGAWIPLAVLVAIACAAPRTLPAGAALAALLLGSFALAQARIQSDAQYERTDWKAAAAALGRPSGPRVIVADDGSFAVAPLSLYLAHSSPLPTNAPAVRVDELDVVGSSFQSVAARLPAGTRLIGRRVVNQLLVTRFSLSRGVSLAPAAIVDRAGALVTPASSGAALLLQRQQR